MTNNKSRTKHRGIPVLLIENYKIQIEYEEINLVDTVIRFGLNF
jgi:hypothetical protein